MERIKQALQRARNSQSPGTRVSRLGSLEIEYEQTRVIEVSEKTLFDNRIIVGHDEHRAAAVYKSLRTQVLRRMEARGWKTLGITSAAPAEGKTLTAVNLAISIAHHFASTVLLADLDLRRPAIAQLFDCEPAQGLTEHLLKGVPLHEVLINPGIERLVILPAGFSPRRTSEMLRSSEMLAFTKELKARYKDRYVLFDLPPLLVSDDAVSCLPYVDCVLLVIEHGKTHPAQLARAVELLQDIPVIGSVLNKCEEVQANHYYQYY